MQKYIRYTSKDFMYLANQLIRLQQKLEARKNWIETHKEIYRFPDKIAEHNLETYRKKLQAIEELKNTSFHLIR